MKFTRLQLTNFLSYKELDLDLTDIAYASVTGRNGSGKSTVPAAIAWVLYGTNRVSGDRDSIVNDLSQSASGHLDMIDNDGNFWQIARGREYSGSGWVSVFEWDPEADDWKRHGDHLNATAEAKIREIVGISEDAFYSLVLVDQSSGSGTRFTGADSNTRRSILHGLVPELALWSQYHATASESLTVARRELGTVDQSIVNIDRELEDQQETLESVKDTIGDETQKSIDRESKRIGDAITKLTRKIASDSDSNIDEIESRIDAAKSKHKLAVSALKARRTELEDELDDRDDAVEALKQVEKRADEAQLKYDKAAEERKTLKKRIKGQRADLEDLNKALERQEPLVSELETKHSKLVSRSGDIKDQIEGLETAIEKDSGECPVCSSPLSTKKCHSMVDELEDEAKEIRQAIDESSDNLKTLRTKLLDNRKLATSAASEVSRGESRLDSLDEIMDDLHETITTSDDSVRKAEKALKKFRDEDQIEADVERTKREIEDLQDSFNDGVLSALQDELQKALKSNSNDELERELKQLKREQGDLNTRSQNFHQMHGRLTTTEENIKRLKDRREKEAKRQEELGVEISELTWLDRALSQKGIPSMLLDSVLGAIEYEQNLILEQLNDVDQMRVEFRQQRELKSRDGSKDVLDIIVHTVTGREKPIEAFSSGQRVRLAISNVFAMIKVFNERSGGMLKTLFLDEPLGPLDEQSIPAFIEVLRVAMNTGIVDSIWVITHDRTVIDALPQEVKVSMEDRSSSLVIV